MKVVKHWHWLPKVVVHAPPLETFKIRLTFGQHDQVKDVPDHCWMTFKMSLPPQTLLVFFHTRESPLGNHEDKEVTTTSVTRQRGWESCECTSWRKGSGGSSLVVYILWGPD